MVRNNDNEAKKYLSQVYNIIMKTKKASEDLRNESVSSLPNIEFRMQTARLLVELSEFKKSVKILDMIIKEEDERVETWYLLGFCLFKLNLFQNA